MPPRLLRPNLRYRCYRVATPFSAHVTIVTLEGEDREGYCFSAGSACRETRAASWEKAFLEAVQGRHYVRYLKAAGGGPGEVPTDFAGHAAWYSHHPEQLAYTVLHHPTPAVADAEADGAESFAALAERLGSERPVLFRNLTPPALAAEGLGWAARGAGAGGGGGGRQGGPWSTWPPLPCSSHRLRCPTSWAPQYLTARTVSWNSNRGASEPLGIFDIARTLSSPRHFITLAPQAAHCVSKYRL
jgi:hypothetical protein